jgi:predicted dehydrogenase
MSGEQPIGIGMVGYAFMGRAHSQGWRSVNRFFDLPLRARMTAICGRDATAVAAAADRLGWETYETDWTALLGRDDVDLVDICTPGLNHAEIAIAALRAGKHVLCEKPLANTVDEARRMVAAADEARPNGIRAMCGFNYRRVPAVALMRRLVADGRLGTIRHVRARYLQDWLVDPEFPLEWRLRREVSGSGALGDLGAHIVDMAQYVTGRNVTGVSALTETFVTERPLPDGSGTGPVTVDDAALFLARFDGGVVGSFEATRFAQGRKNALHLEINGDAGSVAFDLENLNELWFLDATGPAAEAGFRRILVTEPEHPYAGAWWPPGHLLGYEHSFTHQARDLLDDIAAGRDPAPGFTDGLRVQLVLDAVGRSAANGAGWTEVDAP